MFRFAVQGYFHLATADESVLFLLVLQVHTERLSTCMALL